MICPSCSSVVIITKPDKIEDNVRYYIHNCNRCHAEFIITVTIAKDGNDKLVEKYKEWLRTPVGEK